MNRRIRNSIPFLITALLCLSVAAGVAFAQIKADLTIPIPGVGSTLDLCNTVGDSLKCDGLAKYIVATYEWLISFTLFLAVIALMVGGVIRMLAGGSEKRITTAKNVIKNSLVGACIALFSYLALWTISPNLVQFRPLAILMVKEIGLEFEEAEVSTGMSTGECPTANPEEIVSLIDQKKINVNPNPTYGVPIKEQITQGKIDPQILGAIKLVQEKCPESLYISSLMRSNSANHSIGKAVDFAGAICGGHTETMCEGEKTKNLVKTLRGAGYQIGTWHETCFGSFREALETTGSDGPHLHIQTRNACAGSGNEEQESGANVADAGGGVVPANCDKQTTAPCDNPSAHNLVQIPAISGVSLTGGASQSGRAFIHKDALDPLTQASANAFSQGYELSIFSACRPWSHQDDLYKNRPTDPKTGKKKETVAKPGCSNHQYGKALDIHLIDKKSDGKDISTTPIGAETKLQCSINSNVLEGLKKLSEIMYGAGFVRLTFESWHFEYIPGGGSGARCRSNSCKGYASTCGKTNADDCKSGTNGCGK